MIRRAGLAMLACAAWTVSQAWAEESNAIPPDAKVVPWLKFNVGYTVNDVGGAGPKTVEFYYTTDMGRTWKYYGVDQDARSPMLVRVAGEGVYGFRTVGTDQVGNRERNPRPGDLPEKVVIVDRTPPTAKWISPTGADLLKPAGIVFEWETSDAHPRANPVGIEYSPDGGASWLPLKDSLPASGKRTVSAPATRGSSLSFRLVVRDLAGNSRVLVNDARVVMDSTPPTARIAGPAASGSLDVNVDYEAEDNPGGMGLARVTLWYTTDNGQTWKAATDDADLKSPVRFTSTVAGQVGLALVATDKAGNRSPLPGPGTPPAFVIDFDNEKPQVAFDPQLPGGAAVLRGGTTVTLRWSAVDSNIKSDSAEICYSKDGGQTWSQPLAVGLPVNGPYEWNVPKEHVSGCLLKVTVADKLGNRGEALSQPFDIDSSAPVPHIIDIRSVHDDNNDNPVNVEGNGASERQIDMNNPDPLTPHPSENAGSGASAYPIAPPASDKNTAPRNPEPESAKPAPTDNATTGAAATSATGNRGDNLAPLPAAPAVEFFGDTGSDTNPGTATPAAPQTATDTGAKPPVNNTDHGNADTGVTNATVLPLPILPKTETTQDAGQNGVKTSPVVPLNNTADTGTNDTNTSGTNATVPSLPVLPKTETTQDAGQNGATSATDKPLNLEEIPNIATPSPAAPVNPAAQVQQPDTAGVAPDSAEGRRKAAECVATGTKLLEQNRLNDALDICREAVRLDKTNDSAYGLVSKVFYTCGNYDNAIQHALYARKLNGANPAHWLELGQAYHAKARKLDTEIVARQDAGGAGAELVTLRAARDDNAKNARDTFFQVTRMAPNLKDGWDNLADVVYLQARVLPKSADADSARLYQEAVDNYLKGYAIGRGSYREAFQLGLCHYRMNKWSEAQKYLEESVEKAGQEGVTPKESFWYLAEIHEQMNDAEGAARYWDKAADSFGDDERDRDFKLDARNRAKALRDKAER